MDKNLLVSILIPCYNSFDFFEKCIKSCINQTYKNIEIIIIDDGSTDDTFSLMKIYSKRDNRIKIYNQKNMGVSFTRNELISLSTGYYIFFLDSDDFIPKDAIENLVNNSDNGKMDIVIGRSHNIYNFYDDKKIIFPFVPTFSKKIKDNKFSFVKSNMCLLWGYILRKEFFNSLNISFDTKLKYFEDISLATFIFLKCENFKQIKEFTYSYNRHFNKKTNLSSFNHNEMKKLNDFYFALDNLLNLFENEQWNSDKKMRHYINGSFFPIFFGYDLLVKSLSKNILIRSILRRKIFLLIKTHNYKLRISKTWWKLIIYFYIFFNFIQYIKFNKLRRIIFFKENYNKQFIGKAIFINNILPYSYFDLLRKTIIIGDFDFLKSNLEFLKNDYIFFVLKISKKYELEKINDYLSKNELNILGYSLVLNNDLDFFIDNLKNYLLLNFDLRELDENEFEKINDVLKRIPKNINISLMGKNEIIKNINNLEYKYDFLFVEN